MLSLLYLPSLDCQKEETIDGFSSFLSNASRNHYPQLNMVAGGDICHGLAHFIADSLVYIYYSSEYIMAKKRGINWKILIASLVIVYLIAFLGSIFTTKTVSSDWYSLNKPGITPPSFIFPIVWNILFFLIALSIYFSWINIKNKKNVILLFGINLILNFLWSIFFFGMKNPLYAFIDLIFIWLSILFLVIFNWNKSRISSYLLIPYFIWVSFAGYLNYLFLI